jgi:hypothetical protein
MHHSHNTTLHARPTTALPLSPILHSLTPRACFANPGQWTKIAAAVGRTEDDCRTRWRDELRHKAERERGRWTKEEEQKLSDIIVRHNLELGKDAHARDAPWESVVKEMGGSRTTMQCRKKW